MYVDFWNLWNESKISEFFLLTRECGGMWVYATNFPFIFNFSFYLLWLFTCRFGDSTSIGGRFVGKRRFSVERKKEKNQSQSDSLCLSFEDFELKFDCCRHFLNTLTWFLFTHFPSKSNRLSGHFPGKFLECYNSSFWSFQVVVSLET